jgi:hypothetical protein
MEVLGVGIATDTGGPVVLLQERTHPWRIVRHRKVRGAAQWRHLARRWASR